MDLSCRELIACVILSIWVAFGGSALASAPVWTTTATNDELTGKEICKIETTDSSMMVTGNMIVGFKMSSTVISPTYRVDTQSAKTFSYWSANPNVLTMLEQSWASGFVSIPYSELKGGSHVKIRADDGAEIEDFDISNLAAALKYAASKKCLSWFLWNNNPYVHN